MLYMVKESGSLPLYYQYPTQYLAQPAYVWLECDRHRLYAAYDEINGIDAGLGVHLWRTLRWRVANRMKGQEVNHLLNEIASLAQTVLDGYTTTKFRGNLVGRYDSEAKMAIRRIWEIICSHNQPYIFTQRDHDNIGERPRSRWEVHFSFWERVKSGKERNIPIQWSDTIRNNPCL